MRAGAWIKSSWGHVQREGNQLSLTYIAPQLGYWLAAMSPLHSGEKLLLTHVLFNVKTYIIYVLTGCISIICSHNLNKC